jgi:hypothetical protein
MHASQEIAVLSPISHVMDHECVLCVSLCLVDFVLARAVGFSFPLSLS